MYSIKQGNPYPGEQTRTVLSKTTRPYSLNKTINWIYKNPPAGLYSFQFIMEGFFSMKKQGDKYMLAVSQLSWFLITLLIF